MINNYLKSDNRVKGFRIIVHKNYRGEPTGWYTLIDEGVSSTINQELMNEILSIKRLLNE